MAEKKSKKEHAANNSGAGAVYGLGMIGALVYYLGVAEGLWEIIIAFFKALFWPGFFVYEVLKFVAA